MLFALSKIGWAFAAPSRVLFLVVLVGTFAGRRLRPLAAVASLLIAAVSVIPVGGWALAQLEATFPPLGGDEVFDGVLVLGGGLDATAFDARPGSGFNSAFGRLYEAARLARAHPEVKVFDIGGPAPTEPDRRAEADAAADVLVALGVPRERIVVERQSRNTYENAIDAARLAAPAGHVYALVTSAFHMPRAVGCFRRAGFDVRPDPVDYRFLGALDWGFDPVGGLEALDLAAHEYFGLASYRLLGRTEALWPEKR